MKNYQLVIPMSGYGQRFVNAGYKIPKPLIEVDGLPIIQHVVNLFPKIEDIIFICNQNHLEKTDMREILKQKFPNAKILSSGYEKTKGPVDTVLKVIEHLSDEKKILISYCDYSSVWSFDKFVKELEENDPDGCIVGYTGFHPHMLGNDNYAFVKLENNLVVQVKEKEPFTKNKMDEFASNGTYYFKNKKIVENYFNFLVNNGPNINGEYYVSLVYNKMVNDSLKVTTFTIDKMLQWGTPYDLEIYKKWSSYFESKLNSTNSIAVENTTTILPMAGHGNRFKVEGFDTPKPMLEINSKPMFLEAVLSLPLTEKVVFVTLDEHEKNWQLHKNIGNNLNSYQVVSINAVTEGQAVTCQIAIEKSGILPSDSIFISACDNGVRYDKDRFLQLVNDKNVDVIVWSFRNNPTVNANPNMYSWLEVENDKILKEHTKNCVFNEPLLNHAIIGTMFFRKSAYFTEALNYNIKNNIRTNNEFYVDDVINYLIDMNLNVKVFEVDDYICWGTPNDYRTYKYWEEFFTNK